MPFATLTHFQLNAANLVHSAKTRIQATSPTAKGKRKHELTMLSVLLDIVKREGVLGWYRGFAATMLNTFSMRPSSLPSPRSDA